MMRRPPRSPLLPCTTLFRSQRSVEISTHRPEGLFARGPDAGVVPGNARQVKGVAGVDSAIKLLRPFKALVLPGLRKIAGPLLHPNHVAAGFDFKVSHRRRTKGGAHPKEHQNRLPTG